jgi:small subunit ribosomal protein S13
MYLFKTYLEPKQKMKRQLKKIYGLSNFYINKLYNQFGFNQQIFIKDLTSTQKKLLKDWFRTQFLTVNDELKKKIDDTKKKLINLKLYKGFRHKDGLPVRGQRTHTNAKTQKKFKLGVNTTLKNKKWKKTKV